MDSGSQVSTFVFVVFVSSERVKATVVRVTAAEPKDDVRLRGRAVEVLVDDTWHEIGVDDEEGGMLGTQLIRAFSSSGRAGHFIFNHLGLDTYTTRDGTIYRCGGRHMPKITDLTLGLLKAAERIKWQEQQAARKRQQEDDPSE